MSLVDEETKIKRAFIRANEMLISQTITKKKYDEILVLIDKGFTFAAYESLKY